MSDQVAVLSGVAAGVPYVALPPTKRRDGQAPVPLVIAWHLNDPPRSAVAMASALPLADVPAFPLQARRLQAELCQRYRDPERVGLTSIPGMKHAFADEPGTEPAPPTREAKLVDAAVTEWFSRYLT